MLATYGSGILRRPLNYAEWFQLWLNIGRIRLQRAAVVEWGINASRTDRDLPREWFNAIALTPEETDELEFQTNSNRKSSRIAQRGPFGGM